MSEAYRVRMNSEAYRHALHQAHVEANLIPLHDGALDLEEGQPDRGLPVLGRLRTERKAVSVQTKSENPGTFLQSSSFGFIAIFSDRCAGVWFELSVLVACKP